MNTKSVAREFSFRFLFHFGLPIFKDEIEEVNDYTRAEWDQKIHDFEASTDDLTCPENEQEFAFQLSTGTMEHLEDIKERIINHTKNWRLERIARIDYTILLMATYEGLYMPGSPKNMVINEAIELAKKYGGQDSGKFINGILDKILSEK